MSFSESLYYTKIHSPETGSKKDNQLILHEKSNLT